MEDDRELICIGPEKTYALIIGINSYPQLAAGWQRRSPVTEAELMARWLLERGVPVSHIQCFLAKSTAEAAEPLRDCYGQELRCQQPTSNLIQNALLATTLPELPEGSTLIFYWAGHGELGRYSRQLLYDWDYSDQVHRVFDFNDIKQALATERWARLTRQILLVNACANLDTNSDLKFAPVSLPVKDLGSYNLRRQFVVYSSPLGEYAKDDENGRPTPFFEKVFDVLQRLGEDGHFSEYELTSQIKATIETMCPKPRTELWDFDRNYKPWTNDYYLATIIYKLLSNIPVDFERFQKIFHKWFDDQKEPPLSIADLRNRLISLPVSKCSTIKGGFVEFFFHVVEEFDAEGIGKNLETKLFDQIRKSNTQLNEKEKEITHLTSAHNRVKRARARGKPPFFLSFYLTSDMDTSGFLCCVVHDGQFNKIDDHRLEVQPRDKLEEIFKKFYKETIHLALQRQPGYIAQDCDVHFRFYLSAKVMTQIPVHRFLDPRHDQHEVTLARFSPLTLSSYERAKNPGQTKNGEENILDPRVRWKRLFEQNAHVAGIDAKHQSISSNSSFEMRLRAINNNHWLVIDHPPTIEFLDEMVNLGAPFLIWPWQSTDKWPDLQKRLKELIGTKTLLLREAHMCLPDFRYDNPEETEQLVVFWDDYERNGLKELQAEKFRLMFGE